MPKGRATIGGGDARVPRVLFQHAHTDGNAAFPSGGVSTQGEATILIPDNWNGMANMYVWLLAQEPWTNVPVDITINVGSHGEVYTIHNQTVLGTLVTIGNNEYYRLDLTAIFAVVIALMNANDMIWLTLSEQWGMTGYFIGVEINES